MSLPVPHLALGKYAAYVWPAYGVSATVILGLLVQTLARARRWRRAAERRSDDQPPSRP